MEFPEFYHKENANKIYSINYDEIREEMKFKSFRSNYKNAVVLLACQCEFINKKDDTLSVCNFIYENIENIDEIFIPLISHPYISIFSPIFWLNRNGNIMSSGDIITKKGIERGDFYINPFICNNFIEHKPNSLKNNVIEYIETLENIGDKLVLFNFECIFGSVNFSIIPIIEEAVFCHSVTHKTQPFISFTGQDPFSEYKSVFIPNVKDFIPSNRILFSSNINTINNIKKYSKVIFLSLSKEICVNSIADFIKYSNFSGNIYSNMEFINSKISQKRKFEENEKFIKKTSILSYNLRDIF